MRHISSPEHYKTYYLNQAQQGGGISPSFFKGGLWQRGYGQRGGGIGNFFGNLFRRALPLLTGASKHVGRMALKTGANVLTDAASGQNFQDALYNRVRESGNELKRNAVNQVKKAVGVQSGSGRKRKRGKSKDNKKSKKRKKVNNSSIKRKRSSKNVRVRKASKPRTFQDIFGESQ